MAEDADDNDKKAACNSQVEKDPDEVEQGGEVVDSGREDTAPPHGNLPSAGVMAREEGEDGKKRRGVIQASMPDYTVESGDDQSKAASKPGAVRATPRDGGPQYKDQVQSVVIVARDGPAQGEARENNNPLVGARAEPHGGSGPNYKDQVMDVPPHACPPTPTQIPTGRAKRQGVLSPGVEVVRKQGTIFVRSETGGTVTQERQASSTDHSTILIPSADLVGDGSILEAQPLKRRPKLLLWAIVILAALAVGIVAGICGTGACGSSSSSTSDHEYRKPENDDGEHFSSHRGPCPALNTLANHGYINRNGQNINIKNLADAIELVFGADAGDMLEIIYNNTRSGLKTVGVAEDGETPLIDLFDMHVLDHDASLVKEDTYFKQYPEFNETLFERLTANAVDGILTGVQGEAHQRQRIIESRRDNPNVNLTVQIGYVMALQGCLLQFFGEGPVKEIIRVEELETFLKDEKIPESFVLGQPPIYREDYANQESRWIESVMEALMTPTQ